MREYTVIIEKAHGNFSAYAPDLPGCVSTGATLRKTVANMREAIELHVEGMIEDGLSAPPARAVARTIRVATTRSSRPRTRTTATKKPAAKRPVRKASRA